MKPKILREMTVEQLKQKLHDTRKEQFNLRMQKGAGQDALKPHFNIKNRRIVARIKTLLTEKECKKT